MQRLWAVVYDIADPRRLHCVASVLEDVGQRVQQSVFECRLDAALLVRLRARLAIEIEVTEDSVRYYPLCGPCEIDLAWQGTGEAPGEPRYWVV